MKAPLPIRVVSFALAFCFCAIKLGAAYEVREDDEQITIVTDQLEAVVRKTGYVSGVSRGTLLDKQTGFHDPGFGLDIVDWIMEPGSDEAYRDRLDPLLAYHSNNAVHGKRAKRSIEGPQICTRARRINTAVIRGRDFVAVRLWYRYHLAAPGRRTGSLWTQTLVFPEGRRYFISSDRIDAVNSSEAMFLRIDMPGHIRHREGDTFSEIYLSYPTQPARPNLPGLSDMQTALQPVGEGQRIPARLFFHNFPPDAAFNYRRDQTGGRLPQRFIRACRLRDAKSGRAGPWLAGMTLDPSVVWEAWCHQRGYVCMIEEIGGEPVRAGQSFGAAYVVGYFDSIDQMHQVYDQLRGHRGLRVGPSKWTLTASVPTADER